MEEFIQHPVSRYRGENTLFYTRLATCFYSWQTMRAHFFGIWFDLSHIVLGTHARTQTRARTSLTWLRHLLVCKAERQAGRQAGKRTLCAGQEEGFDVINIRFQLFHCELSSRVAALTDFLLLMQSHCFHPSRPFPSTFWTHSCP